MFKYNEFFVFIFLIFILIFSPLLFLPLVFFIPGKYRLIVLLYSALIFGFCFDFSDPLMDSSRYADLRAFGDFSQFLNTYIFGYFQSIESLDITYGLLAYVVVNFFDSNSSILFVFFAVLFVFVQYKYIRQLLTLRQSKISLCCALLVLVIFLGVNPVLQINGFRFWFATWLFVLSIIYLSRDMVGRTIFYSMLSILTHYAFMVLLPVLILLKLKLVPKSKWCLLCIPISFVIGYYLMFIVGSSSLIFGAVLAAKVEAYASPESLTAINENSAKLGLGSLLNRYGFVYFLISYFCIEIFRNYKFVVRDYLLLNFYKVNIAFISFYLLVREISSLARYSTVVEITILTFLFFLYDRMNNGDKFFKVNIFFFLLLAFFMIRLAFFYLFATRIVGVEVLVPIFLFE